MNQDQFLAQRDELARENQLGELELYCTPMTSRRDWARFAVWVFGFLLLTMACTFGVVLVASFAHHSLIIIRQFLDVALYALAVVPVFFIVYAILYLSDQPSVYVYASGLVCLRRSGGRVVRWEEIRKIELRRGDSESPTTLTVYLNDDTRIWLPTLTSQGSASKEDIQTFIEEKMALARRVPDQ